MLPGIVEELIAYNPTAGAVFGVELIRIGHLVIVADDGSRRTSRCRRANLDWAGTSSAFRPGAGPRRTTATRRRCSHYHERDSASHAPSSRPIRTSIARPQSAAARHDPRHAERLEPDAPTGSGPKRRRRVRRQSTRVGRDRWRAKTSPMPPQSTVSGEIARARSEPAVRGSRPRRTAAADDDARHQRRAPRSSRSAQSDEITHAGIDSKVDDAGAGDRCAHQPQRRIPRHGPRRAARSWGSAWARSDASAACRRSAPARLRRRFRSAAACSCLGRTA